MTCLRTSLSQRQGVRNGPGGWAQSHQRWVPSAVGPGRSGRKEEGGWVGVVARRHTTAIIQQMKKPGAYLYFAVFVAGCATLGVEISALDVIFPNLSRCDDPFTSSAANLQFLDLA